METRATARFLRVSPKKVRLVIDVVRGMDVNKALVQLTSIKRDAKRYVVKLLHSAIANAENNHDLKRENLYIKNITADGGPIIGRWRPRAHGRAAEIRKRTTHLTIVLAERMPTEDKAKKAKKEKPAKKEKKSVEKRQTRKKPAKEKEGEKSTQTKKENKK